MADAEFGLGERSARHLMSIAEFVDANRHHGSDLEGMSARALRGQSRLVTVS